MSGDWVGIVFSLCFFFLQNNINHRGMPLLATRPVRFSIHLCLETYLRTDERFIKEK